MWLVHENTYVSPLCKNGSTYVYSLNRGAVSLSLSLSRGREKERERKKNKELRLDYLAMLEFVSSKGVQHATGSGGPIEIRNRKAMRFCLQFQLLNS